ncbi:MAG: DUF2804 family protein [Bdellovibrionota bacterium]
MIGSPSAYFRFPQNKGEARAPLEAAPRRIVEDGLVRLGRFDAPVREMNLPDARLLKGLGGSWPLPPLVVEWVGAGLAHPEWYLGLIVVDAKAGSLAVLYGYNRRTGEYFSHDRPGLRRQVRVAPSTWNDTTSFEGRGFRVEMRHRLEQGFHEVDVAIAASGKKPAVEGRLRWHEELGKNRPLVLMSPLEGGGFLYNHKAQMPIEGSLRIGGDSFKFDPHRDVANMDDLKLHPGGLRLRYRWFNFAGFDSQGRLVGVDLAHADQKGDPYWAENSLWVGDKLFPLDEVDFQLDPRDPSKPWRAADKDGRIALTFFPEGGKAVSLGPLGRYYQKCGRFQGKITDVSGETHEIRDYYGCAECANVLS